MHCPFKSDKGFVCLLQCFGQRTNEWVGLAKQTILTRGGGTPNYHPLRIPKCQWCRMARGKPTSISIRGPISPCDTEGSGTGGGGGGGGWRLLYRRNTLPWRSPVPSTNSQSKIHCRPSAVVGLAQSG